MLYVLYRIGIFLAMFLPLRASYAIGSFMANVYYCLSGKDRRAVTENLRIVLGCPVDEEELIGMARGVFRNFAKYLVDFFRFSKIDEDYIDRFVKIEGLDNVDRALSGGKGAIMLSAHIGNWELGGFVLSLLRPPVGAVVLTHQDKRINNFFIKQRTLSNLKPVEIGMTLRSCYNILRRNGLLAVLGDRDFSKNGLYIEFFGKKTLIPKGPAIFSYRLGSCIVPSFMIREKDDTFRFVFEEPIFPEKGVSEEESVMALAKKYSSVIESYVRRYPAQWYMFRKVWNNHDKNVRPDTVL